ncbi:hypothetical protein [Plasmodium yoelii yoelii]|uniref:Uncharacterized protein n=1 Tax=Plasmodium yoelii yoelii TaxID=73239 RepID=Q7RSJ1_PLAYO|nr:hypothetical protein [Plasmodium yoelii yoelii]
MDIVLCFFFTNKY